jgi:hypothetical protein
MDVLWTAITFAVVFGILAFVVWVFVLAPWVVPSRRRH